MLRVLILAIVLAAAGMISTPRIAKADWCATYSYGGTNCGFDTYRQCMRAVSGNGGYCRRR
jgi:Protein of unknown function (DUF3551)